MVFSVPLKVVHWTKPMRPRVRCERSLRSTSGAAREQQQNGVVLGDVRLGSDERCIGAEPAGVSIDVDDTLIPSELCPVQSTFVADDQCRFAEVVCVRSLGLGPPPVVGRGDGTQLRSGEERDHPLGTVCGQYRDAIAGTHTTIGHARRGCRHGGPEGSEGEALLVEHEVLTVIERPSLFDHFSQ